MLTPLVSFAAQLLAHRKRLGLTQAEAAALLSVGLRTYATWERDDDPNRKPHILTQEGALARLAAVQPPVGGFRCPQCGGWRFGRDVLTAEPLKLGDYRCHSAGCGWRGPQE